MKEAAVTVSVKYTFGDPYYASVSMRFRTLRWVLYLLAAAAAILVIGNRWLGALFNTDPSVLAVIRSLVLLVLAAVLAKAFFTPLVLARSARKSPNAGRTITFRFSALGIQSEGPNGKAELLWSAVARVRETQRQFLLYFNENLAQVIPKRCFGSPEDVAHLRQLIRENFKGKATLRHD